MCQYLWQYFMLRVARVTDECILWQYCHYNTCLISSLSGQHVTLSSHVYLQMEQGKHGQQLRARCSHLANSTKHNAVFDSAPLATLCKRRHPQNRKYATYCAVMTEGTSHGHMWHVAYKNILKVWTCDFWDIQADRQTYIHTRWLQYFTLTHRRQMSPACL